MIGGRSARRLRAAGGVAVLLILLLAIVPGGVGATSVAGPAPAALAVASPTGSGVGSAPHASASVPSAAPHPLAASGRGLFFNSTPVPLPSSTQSTCTYYGVCYNASNNPSLNLTSAGDLGVAYMAYTNQSPCANVSAYAQTEIGFTASTNLGSSWSTPIYLGNPDCSVANQYVDAWQPSLTSLGNGTFVLAYIEFNVSAYTMVPYINFAEYPYSGYSMTYARLVVTESYDGGSTWTTPTVLNTSNNPSLSSNAFTPERPWVTATGATIYVAWMNETAGPGYNYLTYPPVGTGSTQVHLLVSTDGGATWGTPIDLRQFGAAGERSGLNPNVLVDPAGELFVAYATNYTFQTSLGNLSYVFTTDVEVAASTNNGTSFSYVVAASDILAVPYRWGPAVDPSPQLAYAPASGQLDMVYSAGTDMYLCTVYAYCYPTAVEDVYFQNSSTLGATWSAPVRLTHSYDSDALRGGFQAYNPSLAVDGKNVVHVEMTYVNETACTASLYGSVCGVQYQVYLNSSDNGSSWNGPITISGNATYYPYAPDGEYDTMIAAGSRLWIGWTIDICVVSVTLCGYFPSATLDAQVMLSSPAVGPGLTLTFQENNLTSGTPWSVDVLGNVRSANAPTSLSLSGVPAGADLNWTIGVSPLSYGTRFQPVGSVGSPASFFASATVYENFSEQVLVNVSTVPDIPQCAAGSYNYLPCWDNTYFPTVNQNLTPGVGANWVDTGASITFNITGPVNYCTFGFCYYTFENLSFQSWTGTGAGSVNTTQKNITLTPAGPINETANFIEVGWCTYAYFYTPPLSCLASNATFLFHENNLPTGTNWSVTLSGPFGTDTENSTTAWITFASNATIGPVNYTVWTIPAGSGNFYVGTGDPLSPIQLPVDHVVNVNFTSESPTAASFGTTFGESGLPGGTAWTLNLSGASLGVRGAATTLSLAGGSYTVGGGLVYLENSTGYYPVNVTVDPYVSGEPARVYTSLPASIVLNGSAQVTVGFAEMYLLTVTASTGGSVSPGSTWVQSGQSVTLTATVDPGYSFVGWTGSGPGASSSSQRTQNPITIAPRGIVTELATFMPAPASEWNVTVDLAGLPPGVAGTVGIGARTLSGGTTFTATGFLGGTYALTVPFVYENATPGVRYVPTSVTTTFPETAGAVTIGSNGYVNVTYGAEYELSVAATGSGTTTPAPGTAWYSAGATVSLTASPAAGFALVGWTGSGSGSVNTTSGAFSVTVNGPMSETAQFAPAPIPPAASYNLTVLASGLPAGAVWSVGVSATGASGSATSLTVGGLNGTYTVSIPAVYAGTGVRYVPNATSFSVTVTASGAEAQVAFTEQFLVTITSASGGTVSSPTEWVAAGESLTLSATAASGYTFAGWVGNGSGSYTGASATATVTPTGPVAEDASFTPASTPAPAPTSGTAGMPLDLGLLAALLVAGLVVGWLVGRRRSGAPPAEEAPEAPAEP